MNPVSCSFVRPERLALTPYIIPDNRIRSIEYILRGTVILLQADHNSLRIIFFKIQNIPDIGSTEFVNGLIIVTDHTDVARSLCQQTDQLELCRIRILIFIHHDVPEPLLIIFQYIRTRLEQLHRIHDEIIKIHRIVLLKDILILPVSSCHLLLTEIPHGLRFIFLYTHKLVFRGRNGRQNRPFLHLLRINL